MDSSKSVLIGVAVVGAVALGGFGLWSMSQNDKSATDSQKAAQTETNKETPMDLKTITDLAAGTPSLSTLVAGVGAAGLGETLADKNAKYTVFAPTNDAFGKLPAGTLDTLLKPENKSQLSGILTYHVVPAVAMAADLSDGQKIKTVQGAELTVKLQDGKVWIMDTKGGMAQVTTADVKASNGVVHIIDNVLMP